MPRLKTLHLDEFTIFRFMAKDLDEIERAEAEKHLETCATCSNVLREIERLSAELKRLAREGDLPDLAPDDPFYARPETPHNPGSAVEPEAEKWIARSAAASEEAWSEFGRVLEAARDSPRSLATFLATLSLSDPADRYAILYSLQEAGRQIAESPVRWLGFAEEVLNRLGRDLAPSDSAAEAEQILPIATLFGQAHMLDGQASVWIGEYEKAQTHFQLAYRAFARAAGDEVSLAMVEYHESQRRSFTGKASEGLILARRAAATFEAIGLEEYDARARAAEGLALSLSARDEEALAVLRSALPVFEKRDLWSNYVAAVNSIGECLVKLGRLDEAHREHARALRRVSRERHPALVAFVRDGLAGALFSARRYRQAALSFGQAVRSFESLGLVANALNAALFEIESWALSGDFTRASHRLGIFQKEVARRRDLDPSLKRKVEDALAGENPDLRKVAELRQYVGEVLQEYLRREPAS